MTNWQAGEPASHFATAAPQSRGIGPKHRTSILLSRAFLWKKVPELTRVKEYKHTDNFYE